MYFFFNYSSVSSAAGFAAGVFLTLGLAGALVAVVLAAVLDDLVAAAPRVVVLAAGFARNSGLADVIKIPS